MVFVCVYRYVCLNKGLGMIAIGNIALCDLRGIGKVKAAYI